MLYIDMATRFIGKNIRNRVVRPMKNSSKNKNYNTVMIAKEEKAKEAKAEALMAAVAQEAEKKENKRQKKSKDMVSENKLSQMEAIVGESLPKKNVKIEKADKGLYERTEECTVLLTEDNKMLLND